MSNLIQTTGQINVANNYIHSLLDPVSPQDLATKHYVDSSLTSINLFSAGTNGLIVNGSGPNLVLKGLVASSNISITSGGSTSLTFNYSGTGVTLINTGTGLIGGSSSGSISLTTPVSITNGGTNSTTALNGTSIMISNGSSIVQGPTGSSTGVLHGSLNTGTGPFYASVNLTTDIASVLPVINGGTGNSSYTDGQLLIGNSSTGGLTKNTITAGTNISVTNGNGTINIASTIGSGESFQVFTSGTGTWNIPASTNWLRFTLVGGGGGGGGGSTTGGGSGGGAGAIIYSYLIPKNGATSLQYFVGAGGIGGTGLSTAGATSAIIINNMNIVAYAGAVGGTGSDLAGGGGAGSNSSGSRSAGGTGDSSVSTSNYGIYGVVGGHPTSSTYINFFVFSGPGGGAGTNSDVIGTAGATSISNYAAGTPGAAGPNKGGAGSGAGGWGGTGGSGGSGGGAIGFPGTNGLGFGSGGGGGGGATVLTGAGQGGNGAGGLVIIEYFS